MQPRPITDNDLGYWVDYDPKSTVIGGPPSEPDCIPCPAVVTRDVRDGREDQLIIRVPFQLDEIELMHLAQGGTLWLSTWGGLPIHMMEVQEPIRVAACGIDCRHNWHETRTVKRADHCPACDEQNHDPSRPLR